MLRRIVVCTLFTAAATAAAQDVSPTAVRPPEVIANGEGVRALTPDRASVVIGVESRARTPSAAGSFTASRNGAVRAALEALGVPKSDIVTSGYMMRLDPGQFGRDTAFVAVNSVRVTLKGAESLALLARVIDTSLTAGATQIWDVRYEARNSAEAERAALTDAVAAARARAEAMARASGGSLGDLILVTTEPLPYGTPSSVYLAGASAGGMSRVSPTVLSAGELEVRQRVIARWKFSAASR